MKPLHLHTVPGVQPLPRRRRRSVFLILILFFLVAVPAFVFYATGYRYNFFDANASITATGGMYITIGEGKGEVYLNELPVQDLRIFRNAVYIQNLTPGMQRVHVQEPLLHTWVKELPVYPYIVTEAESFTLPLVPQVRPITEYQTSTGTPIIFGTSTPASFFAGVSTSLAVIATTTKATTTFTVNTEYKYLVSLFATSTVASSTLLSRVASGVSEAFTFAKPRPATTTESKQATTTKHFNDLTLYQSGDDIFVDYTGSEQSIPYYFCVPVASLASTTELYGSEVMRGVASVLASRQVVSETSNIARICRASIRIDRQYQTVLDFDFFPSSTDLVVMHRSDGIFVTEVDDRSWQNTQGLYPHSVDEMVISNGKIYVKKGKMILELLTAIPLAS